MSILTPTASWLDNSVPKTRSAPRPPTRGGPVLMADCTTPLAGETLLALLWKRWESDGGD